MFFNAGKLLMLLYITNTNNISRKDIKYKNNRFYIDINKGNQNIKIINTITSENIINNLIEKSTYNKEFLPIEIEDINEKNLLDIEEGFKAAYEIFIYEKINLMNFFRKYHIKNSFSLINDIKILNEQDLKRQLKFVRLKLKGELKPNELVKNFIWFKHDKEKFIDSTFSIIRVSVLSLWPLATGCWPDIAIELSSRCQQRATSDQKPDNCLLTPEAFIEYPLLR